MKRARQNVRQTLDRLKNQIRETMQDHEGRDTLNKARQLLDKAAWSYSSSDTNHYVSKAQKILKIVPTSKTQKWVNTLDRLQKRIKQGSNMSKRNMAKRVAKRQASFINSKAKEIGKAVRKADSSYHTEVTSEEGDATVKVYEGKSKDSMVATISTSSGKAKIKGEEHSKLADQFDKIGIQSNISS